MANEEYSPRDDQAEDTQMPENPSDAPPQTAGMPDVQRDQSESYDRQNSPKGWSPGQQMEGALEDSDDSLRGEQLEDHDQRQASDAGQVTDDDYGSGQTGNQSQNQSDQDY